MGVEDSGPLLLSLKLVAERLGLSEWQVRGLIDDGTLPAERIKNRIYVPAGSVVEYVEAISGRSA
jgi:hypothetical protein